MNIYKCIKGESNKNKCRAYRLLSGDEVYFNTTMIKTIGYPYDLELGQTIKLYPDNNNIIEKGVSLLVTEIHKTKKYPNKKWWQFWLKQEEYIDGYNLKVI